MTDRIAVGTPVTVSASSDNYLSGYGMSRDDLVVLAHIDQHYGLGPSKNMGGPAHSRDGWIYFSDSQVTAKPQESKVTQFKAGDKVEFTEDYPAGPAKTGDRATVQYVDDGIAYFEEAIEGALYSRLKLVEETPFTFKDIQVGDTIRRTRTYKSGATEVREGVVFKVKNGYVAEEGNAFILAYDTDDRQGVTLELLNRPEPVKEVWEDAKVGDVFKRVNKAGEEGFVIRTEGGWKAVYETNKTSSSWVSPFSLASTHIFEGQTVTKL